MFDWSPRKVCVGRRRGEGDRKIFEEIMAEKLPNLIKTMNPQI